MSLIKVDAKGRPREFDLTESVQTFQYDPKAVFGEHYNPDDDRARNRYWGRAHKRLVAALIDEGATEKQAYHEAEITIQRAMNEERERFRRRGEEMVDCYDAPIEV